MIEKVTDMKSITAGGGVSASGSCSCDCDSPGCAGDVTQVVAISGGAASWIFLY